jgi:hypothetical protein
VSAGARGRWRAAALGAGPDTAGAGNGRGTGCGTGVRGAQKTACRKSPGEGDGGPGTPSRRHRNCHSMHSPQRTRTRLVLSRGGKPALRWP